MLIWVPADWVAAGLAGLPGAEVEIVSLGRDMGQSAPGRGDTGRGDLGAGATGGGGVSPPAVPARVAEVEFYVPSFFPSQAGSAVLSQMRSLRVVQALTAGVDWIRPHVPSSVALCNARGAHDASTAEWVVAAMLASLRSFPLFGAAQAEGRWNYQGTGQLAGGTVLIVGYGAIGAAVEQRLAGFEVTVRRVARSPRPGVAGLDDLPSLLPEADAVVLLVPFTPESKGLAGSDFLARMKDGALLVNAARGAVVDTAALVAEVASGRLRAALDVTDPEPLPPGHPLWSLPGIFLTPHVAASTPVSRERAARLVREQARAYLRGEPLRNVISGAY
ncbi:MAG TPA: 2-hydroxyacid dehydrogenase [Trebonia sp.]